MAKVKITQTVLNSAQHALMSTIMPLQDILPGLKLLDNANYYSCEVWGRSSYISSMQVLNEDPWERLKAIKEHLPNTKLQITTAGQYLFGIRPFADDVVVYFIQRAAANGVQILRVYDPLNDLSNLEVSIRMARQEGMHVQGSIVYTTSDVHNTATFIAYGKKLEEMGADSICIIDNSELLTPYSCYNLIATFKKELTIPIQFSTTNASGRAYLNVIKATEAGVDMVDAAVSAFANGASYPSCDVIATSLKSSPYDTGMNVDDIYKVNSFFETLRDEYLKDNLIDPRKMLINTTVSQKSVPAEMLDYLDTTLLANQQDYYEHVLNAIPDVCRAAGNPPLAFPIYRGIVDQAVLNATIDIPYGKIANDYATLLNGGYGITPAAVDPGFRDSVLKNVTSGFVPNHSSKVSPELEEFNAALPNKYNEQNEDVLTLAQFPIIAPTYFENRSNKLYKVDGRHSDEPKGVHPI